MLELQLYLLLLWLCPLAGGVVGYLLVVLPPASDPGLVLLGCQLLVIVLLPLVGPALALSGGVIHECHLVGVSLLVVLAPLGVALPGCPAVVLLVPQLLID